MIHTKNRQGPKPACQLHIDVIIGLCATKTWHCCTVQYVSLDCVWPGQGWRHCCTVDS